MGVQLTPITNSLSRWLATGEIFATTLASKGDRVSALHDALEAQRQEPAEVPAPPGKREEAFPSP